jgi:hypothetical protein
MDGWMDGWMHPCIYIQADLTIQKALKKKGKERNRRETPLTLYFYIAVLLIAAS